MSFCDPELWRDLAFWILFAKATQYGLPIFMCSPNPPIDALFYWTDPAGLSVKSDNGFGCIRFEDKEINLPPFLFYHKWPKSIQENIVSMSAI